MPIFKRSQEPQPVAAMTREKTGRPSASGENGISIIGPGMYMNGDLVTDGTVRIEGRVEGTIRAGRALVLGKDAEVVGEIIAQDVVIAGRVTGTVLAENRLELQNTAVIEGEIRARAQHLKLDEGARFNGQIRMMEADAEPMRALPAEVQIAAVEG